MTLKGVTYTEKADAGEMLLAICKDYTGNTKLGLPTIIHLANVLDVSVDELLCDNIHRSEKIFQNELAELLQGCDAHELHLITELAKVVKKNSLDGVKKTRGRKPKNKI